MVTTPCTGKCINTEDTEKHEGHGEFRAHAQLHHLRTCFCSAAHRQSSSEAILNWCAVDRTNPAGSSTSSLVYLFPVFSVIELWQSVAADQAVHQKRDTPSRSLLGGGL